MPSVANQLLNVPTPLFLVGFIFLKPYFGKHKKILPKNLIGRLLKKLYVYFCAVLSKAMKNECVQSLSISTASSPLLNARRVKTDLQTSENIFLQFNSLRSRSSSPILPLKKFTIQHCEKLREMTMTKVTAVNGKSNNYNNILRWN